MTRSAISPLRGCRWALTIRWALVLLGAAPLSALAEDITAYAEESAPYHYTESGATIGVGTEILQAACKVAKITCEIKIVPWARAYAVVTRTPNTLIFSIVRTPERESQFIWLAPAIKEAVWVWGRGDSPPVHNVADLAKVRIGVINNSSAAVFLRDAGVPASSMDYANSVEGNFRKFSVRRVDFIVNTELRMAAEQVRYKLPFNTVKVFKLRDATSYFAINPQSDPVRTRALQAALEEVRSGGALEQILNKYVPRTAN